LRRLASLRGATLLAAGGGVLALAVTGGDLANSALRAVAVVALVGAAGAALRRRARSTAPPLVDVLERRILGRETGVAVLAAEGRRLLVGYGPAGVRLLATLAAQQERLP
jgi:flagellar biogenesis protein FliO